MEGLRQNLRFTLRGMRAGPGVCATVLLTIAVGIGVTTAIFTVVYATLLAPLPYPRPDRLVNVWSKLQGGRTFVSTGDFQDWKNRSTVFDDLETAAPDNFNLANSNLAAGARPEYLDGMEATPGYLAMLGDPLAMGRNFVAEEGQPGKDHVVILTNRLWRHLGADPRVLGQSLRINGDNYTVVGVLAPGVADRWDEELVVPLAFAPQKLQDRSGRFWVISGRLRPGITIAQAQSEMDSIAAQEAREFPGTNAGWGVAIEPFQNDFLPAQTQRLLWLLLGGAGFVLLIACLNVANLLLARSTTRRRETAIRGALGASRGAIFAQFLTESLALAITGGVLGAGIGSLVLRGMVAVIPSGSLPSEADVRLNLPVLLAMFGISVAAGALFGSVPAWYSSSLDPALALRDGGRAGTGVGGNRLRRMLVMGEFAVALPLLACGGMTIHSFWNLTHLDLGVRTDHVFGFYVDSPPLVKGGAQAAIEAYYRRVLVAISAVPGVVRASAMTYLPLDFLHLTRPFRIAGQPEFASPAMRPSADMETVTPDYFATFGIQIIKGRAFDDHDDLNGARVAMVNEAFVKRYLKGVDALQQRLIMTRVIPGGAEGPSEEWRIIGVFHDVKSRNSREDNPEIDTPFWQEAYSIAGIGVRTATDPGAMIKSVQAAIGAVDPGAGLALTRTLDEVHNQALGNDRLAVILLGSFALLGLFLAAVGIYGVMAFSVTQRSREMAVRLALGAPRGSVVRLIVSEGAALAGCGAAAGCILTYYAGKAMQGTLFGVAAVDAGAVGGVGLLLFGAALLACYLPGRRAAAVDPMPLLRSD